MAVGSPICSYSERFFEADRIRERELQIGARQSRPFPRRPRRWFEKMRDGETCSQGGTIAAIERKQFIGRAVAQSRRDTATNVTADPRGAEPFAFETQKSDFVERVRRAQRGIELQAVDDAWRVAEADMLRPQVAMSVHDAPCPHATGQKRGAKGEEQPLRTIDVADQAGRHAEARFEQDAPIVAQVPLPGDEMPIRRYEHRRCPPVELTKRRHQPVELPGSHAALH